MGFFSSGLLVSRIYYCLRLAPTCAVRIMTRVGPYLCSAHHEPGLAPTCVVRIMTGVGPYLCGAHHEPGLAPTCAVRIMNPGWLRCLR